MSKILISACLLGKKVRYDGGDCLQDHPKLKEWIKDNRIVSVCPEVAGGLSTPRPPAEIQASRLVLTNQGKDVTNEFKAGAEHALALVKKYGIKVAILKARSPSCGSSKIYDGSFSKTIVDGDGVTTKLLKEHGVQVFSEEQIDEALVAAEVPL